MQQVRNIEHFVDDILVHTVVWTEHMAILRELLNKIRKVGLTIHPSKCCLDYSFLELICHMVGSNRIAMEEDKLDKIQDATAPKRKKQVKSFVGLARYYRKFLPNYAVVATPLTDLTEKANKVTWE